MSPDQFKSALAHFPTGVAILTTKDADSRQVGLTVSSFNSVSLDPQLVLWSIARSTPSYHAFREAPFFCVNVLAASQADVARHFARPCCDKFAGIAHVQHATGIPVLAECAAYLVCRTWNTYDGGDHLIIVGEVIDGAANGVKPLVFGLGAFCTLSNDAAAV
jgi:flavin reductase (DIM6/NTAB) family NADH-FMN oxidoreductase RutF